MNSNRIHSQVKIVNATEPIKADTGLVWLASSLARYRVSSSCRTIHVDPENRLVIQGVRSLSEFGLQWLVAKKSRMDLGKREFAYASKMDL